MRLYLSLLTALLLTGCGDHALTERAFEEAKWRYADSLSGAFPVKKGVQYRLGVAYDLNDDYPYRNLYLKLSLQPEGDSAAALMNEYIVSDEAGEWSKQRSFWNGSYSYKGLLADSLSFPKDGACRFVLKQYMRDDTLKGVRQAKILLEEIE